MTPNQIIRALPLLILLIFSIALSLGLFNGENNDKSRLIGGKISSVNLSVMGDKTKWFSPDKLGQTAVIHIFASWSEPCRSEHAALMKLSKTRKVAMYGVAWRDKDAKVAQWLNKDGNPYDAIAVDELGISTVSFAISNIPETLVLSKDGVVQYHTTKPLTDDIINNTILPLVDKLNAN